jgi:hypothetical protein
MNMLQNRANAAIAKIASATTPRALAEARREGLAVKAELEKHLRETQALALFKSSQPQRSFGKWKGSTS